MDKRLGLVIGASLLFATVQPDPNKNACITLADLAEPCGCTVTEANFEPICGSDGHIHLTPCFLACRKAVFKVDITINNTEDCTNKSLCPCNSDFAPVCGTNGITYSNECVLGCATIRDTSIMLQHVGECASGSQRSGTKDLLKRKKCQCAAMHRPVCGNDLKTYANFCALDCVSKKRPEVQMSHWGDCTNSREMD